MGGSDEIEETEYEKELAAVYSEQWDYYKSNIVPEENKIIEDAKDSNDQSVYQGISDDANLGYQRSFAEGSNTTAQNMAASGIDPSSNKFKNAIGDLSDIQGSVTADATTRAQIDGQDRHITKMSNVMAMGQGEAQESVASLSDIAVNSQREAISDASNSAQSKASTLGAVGAAGGAWASNHLNSQKPTSSNETNGVSLGASNINPEDYMA